MIIKIAETAINLDKCYIEALNRPTGWDIFDGDQELSISRMKIASVTKETENEDLGGFDITAAVDKHPDHLFAKIFAIKQNEFNDNGDCFSGEELSKAAHTFVGVPLFCNHANNDIEKARGKVVHAWYDAKKGGIWIIGMVDKVAYPKLARGIEEGYVTGTSMGCQVHHSICSICHNRAHTADEYCTHIKNQKTRKFSGKVKCCYHKSTGKDSLEEKCPICSSVRGDIKELQHKDATTGEWNIGLKFIENSFVVNQACHDCQVECILNVPEMSKSANSIFETLRPLVMAMGAEQMQKFASTAEPQFQSLAAHINHVIEKVNNIATNPISEKLLKVSGKIEIDNLNRAMKYVEVVAKSMMDQKEQVSLEYVSDIVEVLASLQTVTDELVEMGYANIQSPPTLQDPESLKDAVPLNQKQSNQTAPGAMAPAGQVPQMPQAQIPQQGASPAAPSPGGVGSVTKPTFASEKIKELNKVGENTVKNDTVDSDGTHGNKESINVMSTNTKTAANQGQKPEFQEKTTEKQLEEAKLEFHARTGESPSGITESDKQLGKSSETVNDTTSDSPQVRKGDYAEVTTENQLAAFTDSPIARWNDFDEVITEKQWTDFSRAVGADLSKDQKDGVTQVQLEDLRSKHRWVDPVVTTENQLASDANWLTTDNAWLNKSAAANYSKALVTAAINTLVDAIANYNVTPTELVKAVKMVTRDPQTQIKAAFVTLVNGMPQKIETRKAEVARAKYFGKFVTVTPVEALLACAGDHCLNLKAEDLIDTIRYVASDTQKMASVESQAKVKLAQVTVSDQGVDKFAELEKAYQSLQPEPKNDGIYVAEIKVANVGVDPDDVDAFVVAVERMAKAQVPAAKDAVLYSVDIDNDMVMASFKDADKLTAKEKEAIKQAKSSKRAGLVKEAQAMGGELGGGMGGGAPGGGGGATMPAPPAGGAPPAAPPLESMTGPENPGAEEDTEDNEALPPGSICPVCASEDVDIIGGKGRCNNCKGEFIFKVQIDVTKWPGVNDTSANNGDEEMPDLNEELGTGADDGAGQAAGEGFAMPGGAGAEANIPVAAMTRVTPEMMQKVAGDANYKLGSISPLTGSKNTFELGNGEWLCLDTGRTYSVNVAVDKKDVKNVFAEWRWTPKTGEECTSCQRAKMAWASAMKHAGISEDEFKALSFRQRADKILEMHDKGFFKVVKTASKNATITNEIKAAYAAKVFPMDECRAKIAKRYGENAISMSGPHKGKKLADCVCEQLKNASVYSDGLALKVADTWKDKDACVECMEDYVRLGYDMEKAAMVCQYMKLKYASGFELFAEELSDSVPFEKDEPDFQGDETDEADDFGSELEDDPFEETHEEAEGQNESPLGDVSEVEIEIGEPEGEEGLGGEMGAPEAEVAIDLGAPGGMPSVELGGEGKPNGTVTIELPLSALDAIEQAIDLAHGEDAGAEPHHDIPPGMADQEVEIDIPEESAEGLEEAIEPVLEEEVGTEGPDHNEELPTELPESPVGEEVGGEMGETSPEETPVPENTEFKEGDMEQDRLASFMHKGKTSRVGEINLDIDAIAKALNKSAATPKVEGAQDVVKDYTAGDGSTQGGEKKFDADKPDVPRDKAEMGEGESNPQDKPLPDVAKADGKSGNLDGEENFKAETGVNMSGGNAGQGKTKTKSEASAKTQTKQADKLSKPQPVSDTDGLKVPRSNKDHADTPEKMKRTTFSPKDYPEKVEKGEGARIKGEVDNGSVPKGNAPEYTPDIPVGGAKAALDGEEKPANEYKPEKQLERSKGTVSAKSENNQKKIEAEAVRIAGRMVATKMIQAGELLAKIEELRRYEIPTLQQIEKTLFSKTAQKGLATEPDGVEQPVNTSEASNKPTPQVNPQEKLAESLQSLFTLHKRNKMVSEDNDAAMRKAYNR